MEQIYQLPIRRIKCLIDEHFSRRSLEIDPVAILGEYTLRPDEVLHFSQRFSINSVAAIKVHVLNCAIDLAYSEYFNWVKESKYFKLRNPVEVEGRYNDEIKHISELMSKADSRMASELASILYGLEVKSSRQYPLVPMINDDMSKILKNVIEHISELKTSVTSFKFDDSFSLAVLVCIEAAAHELICLLDKSLVPVDSVLYSEVKGDILILQSKLKNKTEKPLSFDDIRREANKSLASVVGPKIPTRTLLTLSPEELQIVLRHRARNDSEFLRTLFATNKFREIIEGASEIETMALSPEVCQTEIENLLASLIAELRNAQYAWRTKK